MQYLLALLLTVGLISPAPAASGWGWPASGATPVRLFDPPPQPWLAGHRGVDLALPARTVIVAAGSGTVRFAGVIAGRGVVSIDHADGLRTTYEPVDPLVKAGASVGIGELIGTLQTGHPDCAAAACLHWGLRQGDTYLDPLALVGRGKVRLLP